MKTKEFGDEVPKSSASGHRIVSVKRVGSKEKPDISAHQKWEDSFAATPPWELKKELMSHATGRTARPARCSSSA